MNLGELKEAFDQVDDDDVLYFGIISANSWRGSYDEVSFTIGRNVPASKCKLVILRALTETFCGYKGGEYRFDKDTTVNFEAGIGLYSDGKYREEMINEIIGGDEFVDRDKYLVDLLVKTE